MQWILIIITFWRPDISVSQVEMQFATEQECLDQQLVFEEKFMKQKDSDFGWMLYCINKDLEIDYD